MQYLRSDWQVFTVIMTKSMRNLSVSYRDEIQAELCNINRPQITIPPWSLIISQNSRRVSDERYVVSEQPDCFCPGLLDAGFSST